MTNPIPNTTYLIPKNLFPRDLEKKVAKHKSLT